MDNNHPPTIFLIRGIPGSSRGLVANKLASPEYPVYSADDYFMTKDGEYKFEGEKLKDAHLQCQQQVEDSMQKGIDKIFVSNTFVEDWEMAPYFVLAKVHRYMVHTIIVENRHRGSTDKIPQHSAERMRDRFSIFI